MSQLRRSILPNGVRVLVESHSHVRSAAIGITCRAGSRHELDHEAGITHFIEHMLFKGTEKRSAKEIAASIEGRGGVLNAFTDKEQTTYYCRVLGQDVTNAIDVLSDMVLNSLLNEEELQREKGVVLEEIRRGEDEPSDQVHELHISGRWGEHPLGKPVIGTKESVSSFSGEMLRDYMARRYQGGNLLISIAGDCNEDEVIGQIESLFAGVPSGGDDERASAPAIGHSKNLNSKDVEQVHFCIGGDSVSIHDSRIHTAAVLDATLGGGMSSRLFQEIREKRGLAYAVGSYNLSYSGAGLFTIYGGTSLQTWDQVQELVTSEIRRFVNEGFEDGELERVKLQMSGNMVLALEGMNTRMLRNAKNEMNFGREIPLDETLEKINQVTDQGVRDFCAEMLDPDRLSVTAIGPFSA